MITVIGGIKGGGGKSTIAVNLTVILSSRGKRVLLVDADELQSSSDFVEHRQALGINTPWVTMRVTGRLVGSEVLKVARDFDEIVIDVGGRDTQSQRSAMVIGDYLIVPVKPRSFDLWTISSFRAICDEAQITNPKLKILSVLSQADYRGVNNKATAELLAEEKIPLLEGLVIRSRISFANSIADGLGVIEQRPGDKKAISEILTLYKAIYEESNECCKEKEKQ